MSPHIPPIVPKPSCSGTLPTEDSKGEPIGGQCNGCEPGDGCSCNPPNEPRECTCDFETVIMVTGCQCGGK
jgi:hypothetical protein